MRVLVTGSRDWDDEYKVIAKLVDLNNKNHPQRMILVSGNCPTGAEFIARKEAEQKVWLDKDKELADAN